jgi:hypothetical protein
MLIKVHLIEKYQNTNNLLYHACPARSGVDLYPVKYLSSQIFFYFTRTEGLFNWGLPRLLERSGNPVINGVEAKRTCPPVLWQI